jgi:hypothetical protein
MSKDQSGTEIKIGDRVTIGGEVIHVAAADSAPCQVKVDVPTGDEPPIVSFESRVLKVAAQKQPTTPPMPEPPKANDPPAPPAPSSAPPAK